jgi:O-antigen/teichoic acid export membrane protein
MKILTAKNIKIVTITLLTLLSGATNYLFQILVARSMGPSRYGEIATTLGLMSIVTTAGVVFQTSASKQTVLSLHQPPRLKKDQFTQRITQLALSACIGILLVSPLLAHVMNLSLFLFIPIALFSFPALHESLASGRLQGINRYEIAILFAVLLSLSKLCALFLTILFDASSLFLISVSVLLVFFIVSIESYYTRRAPAIRSGFTDLLVRKQLLITITILILQNLDAPLARYSLGDFEAGKFVAASQLGKITLILPIMLTQFAFPYLVKDSIDGIRTTFKRVLREVIFVSGVLSLTLVLFHDIIVTTLLGSEYRSSSMYAWQISLAIAPLSIANLYLLDSVARGSLKHSISIVSSPIVFIGVVLILPKNPSVLVLSCFLASVTVLSLMFRSSHQRFSFNFHYIKSHRHR